MPTLPSFADLRGRHPMTKVMVQPNIWALAIFAIATSSVLLGFAVAMNLKSPVRNGCDNKNDPVFWQGLGQLLLRVLLLVCVLVPVLRDYEDRVRVSRPVFYLSVSVGIVSEILALVLYGNICGTNGWLAGLLLGWGASVSALAAAAQLAGGLVRLAY